MSKVYVGMRQKAFCGSSCYSREVNIPGLHIETWANGGMEGPSFVVSINGMAHYTDDMESLIEYTIREHLGNDTDVLYTHYNDYGPSKTVDPWNKWRG